MEQKWNRGGAEVEQKWNGSGTEVEQTRKTDGKVVKIARGGCRRFGRGYFVLFLPKVLPRGFAAGSAGGILL